MASPLVGIRADPCPHCGSAEVYLRADGAPQCKDCKWTGPPRYDSKYLQSWSTVILPPSQTLPAPETPHLDPTLRRTGGLLIAAAVAHLAAVFAVLYVTLPIPWLETLLQYHYLDWTMVLGLSVVTLGIILQSVFAVVAIAGAVVVLGDYKGGAPVFGTVGIAAILFSLLLFGGPVGVAGGALLAAAAAALRPSLRTRSRSYAPA